MVRIVTVSRYTPTDNLLANSSFEQECVVLFIGFLRALGQPSSVGAIYGVLFASDKPLCFTDFIEKLEMSKGSVSQGLALLRQIGAVQKVTVSGDRREFFIPELGLRRLASGLIREKIQPLAKETQDAVSRLREGAAKGQGDDFDFQTDRIKQLENWHRQLGRVLPVVQTLLKVSRS